MLASENDAASPAIAASPADDRAPRPRRPLVEHINSIRDRVLEGKRRGEFGTPPDPKQMMDLANDEVRRLKEAGEIPAQLEVRFKITANAFFFEVPPTRTPPADRATRGEE